jgi:hypothetical protein
MDETQTEITESENTGERNKPKKVKLIDDANAAAERLEKATEAQQTENDRLEELQGRQRLGGTAEAGSPKDVKPKVETNQEYVDKMRDNNWRAADE